jgi:hypothetical protein
MSTHTGGPKAFKRNLLGIRVGSMFQYNRLNSHFDNSHKLAIHPSPRYTYANFPRELQCMPLSPRCRHDFTATKYATFKGLEKDYASEGKFHLMLLGTATFCNIHDWKLSYDLKLWVFKCGPKLWFSKAGWHEKKRSKEHEKGWCTK